MNAAVDDGDRELPLVDPFEPYVGNVLDAFAPMLPDKIDRVKTLDMRSSVRISSSFGFRATPRRFHKSVVVSNLIVTVTVAFEKFSSRDSRRKPRSFLKITRKKLL